MTGVLDPADGGRRADAGDELTEVVDTCPARIGARGGLGLHGAGLLTATVVRLRGSGAGREG